MSAVTDALLGALERVDLAEVARPLADADGDAQDIDETAREQFLRAFTALLREGLTGGREQRELVMETAVPALVAAGQTPLDLLHAHTRFFVALAPVLVAEVPTDLRGDARLWLARYAAEYTREVTERALATGPAEASP